MKTHDYLSSLWDWVRLGGDSNTETVTEVEGGKRECLFMLKRWWKTEATFI